MNIIGNFIKGVINVTDKITGDDNPIEEQKEVLKNLLKSGKDTSISKAYGFDSVLENEDIQTIFKLNVPYFATMKSMSETDFELSSKIIPARLNPIIYTNEIGLKVSEIEGDTVLFFKTGKMSIEFKNYYLNILRIK